MTIEEEIRETVEEAVEAALPDEDTHPEYLVPEHEHPGINERLSVIEARLDGVETTTSTLLVHELEEEIVAEETAPPEPEPVVVEEIDEATIVDEPEEVPEETPEETPEEVLEDEPPRRSWWDRFWGEVKK